MRFIQQDKHNPNTLSVSWMWLPTFIGQNQQLLGELDHVLNAKFPPPIAPSSEDEMQSLLDEIHSFVIEYLDEKLGIPGLNKYLSAIKSVGEEG